MKSKKVIYRADSLQVTIPTNSPAALHELLLRAIPTALSSAKTFDESEQAAILELFMALVPSERELEKGYLVAWLEPPLRNGGFAYFISKMPKKIGNIVKMSQRGSLTLFADIFEQPLINPTDKRKGRSSSLNDRRNECLLDRYYWHGRLEIDGKRISYNSLLRTISDEFFLSTVTIPEIVQDNLESLIALKHRFASLDITTVQRQMQKKWPHLVWKVS